MPTSVETLQFCITDEWDTPSFPFAPSSLIVFSPFISYPNLYHCSYMIGYQQMPGLKTPVTVYILNTAHNPVRPLLPGFR